MDSRNSEPELDWQRLDNGNWIAPNHSVVVFFESGAWQIAIAGETVLEISVPPDEEARMLEEAKRVARITEKKLAADPTNPRNIYAARMWKEIVATGGYDRRGPAHWRTAADAMNAAANLLKGGWVSLRDPSSRDSQNGIVWHKSSGQVTWRAGLDDSLVIAIEIAGSTVVARWQKGRRPLFLIRPDGSALWPSTEEGMRAYSENTGKGVAEWDYAEPPED
jgi:hypothetical protein